MFLTSSKFKFIDIKNFLAPGLSYEKWCKSLECNVKKLVFPYEWLTSYEKLDHVGPVDHEAFYSTLSGKNTLSIEDYQAFRDEFFKRECVTMLHWLAEYNMADVIPFIEAVDKTHNIYYEGEIDILKDAVSIPGVSMRYVVNKSLRLNHDINLYAPGDPCKHKCEACCTKARCEDCKQVQKDRTYCTENEAYELLQTGMVGGPAIVFCRYHERDVTGIRSHIYNEPKKCRTILGYDANMLYPSTLMQDFPCGKEKLIRIAEPTEGLDSMARDIIDGSLFGFCQVDIEVPAKLYEKFSEMSQLFVVREIPDNQIPQHMHDYLTKTGENWYLNHGLKITACYQILKYSRGKPFAWFPEEIANARRQADKDPNKRIAGDTAKLKGNSFYGKMIEDLARHNNTTFTKDEKVVDAAMRSPYLEDLEEIGDAYELRRLKQGISINRAYQCGIYVYQSAKLRMLEFYYNFLDKYLERRDFEYIYMDTAYFAISGENLRTMRMWLIGALPISILVAPEVCSKKNFIGFRMIALTGKCYFVEGKYGTKFSCKGMSKRQNEVTWLKYTEH
ncbi:uncharacterized protein LOC130637032 [Hydractinia symbiolongicarpus]|uniref:uncharacterized protein LOC130637032 n=1 Tax=Hydractinia symbiolongicarpus TaxID=13093 RepID=UPI00254A7219|nr:uncharacterized protein LOC130637032 [Hydractinia symbiolongicarpus]